MMNEYKWVSEWVCGVYSEQPMAVVAVAAAAEATIPPSTKILMKDFFSKNYG